MNIFVDENIPAITVQTLVDLGHEVKDIRGTINEGMEDEDLWDLIQSEACLFITTDKGFSHNRNLLHNGMIIVRLKQPNALKIHKRIMYAFDQFTESEWKGLLVTLRDTVQSISKSKL